MDVQNIQTDATGNRRLRRSVGQNAVVVRPYPRPGSLEPHEHELA